MTRSQQVSSCVRIVVVLIGLGAMVVFPTPAIEAQTTDPETPASSPLWWTLTDDVSPRELRQTFRDRDASLEHYLEAVEKGLVTLYPPEQLEDLVYFHSGALHPELLPFWEAFDAFALRFRYRTGWSEKAPAELRSHGLSEEGARLVIEEAQQHLRDTDALKLELGTKQRDFLALSKKAAAAIGPAGVRHALENRDTRTLARAAGESTEQVQALMRAWETDPTATSAQKLLPRLKESLSPEDWEGLRAYLLAEVAPVTSAIDFDDPEAVP
jgi:hypothetical protein